MVSIAETQCPIPSRRLVQIGFSIPDMHLHARSLGFCPFARGKGTGHIENMLTRPDRIGESVDDGDQVLFVCTVEVPSSEGLLILS